ncbi:hypothetical protein HID58_061409 [Brassica napus]|uniref:Uncharacterized protein n=1 Tax=Brassica napus TaxID=3708 RepID=A0ABQ7ZYP0_BRANA|nr:hypothetical protein HID58_061409 [Brassica napus]
MYDPSRRRDRDKAPLTVAGFFWRLCLWYTRRLLPPVVCGFFDGAVRLLTPRHALLDGDGGFTPGFSRKIDDGGIDCRRLALLDGGVPSSLPSSPVEGGLLSP